jgi:hypothetical protein
MRIKSSLEQNTYSGSKALTPDSRAFDRILGKIFLPA